ncbi:hypothetical protein QTG54_014109, partial [Skeletonema marinoi]
MARTSDRICETLDQLNDHLKSFKRFTNAKVCEVCGKETRNWNEGCILAFHNISFFGFGLTQSQSDSADFHKKQTNTWAPPTQTAIDRNKRRIRDFCKEIENDIVAAHDEDDDNRKMSLSD